MKKLLLLSGLFVGIILMFSSCEKEDCKICALVTYDANGTEIDRELEAEYCDDELNDKENDQGTTVDNVTTKWVCW